MTADDLPATLAATRVHEARDERHAVKETVAFLHDAMLRGDFAAIAHFLWGIDERRICPAVAVACLMATLPVKDEIAASRNEFCVRAASAMGDGDAKELGHYL